MRKVLLFALLVAGCASQPPATEQAFEKRLNLWIGKDVNALVQKLGPPNSTFKMPNGNVMYTYARSNTVQLQGYTLPSQTTGTVVGNAVYGTTVPGPTIGGGLYTASCKVDYTVEGTTIVNWRHEGNACKADEE